MTTRVGACDHCGAVIDANLPPFLEYLHKRDAALPRFVAEEFKDYLHCGRRALKQ